MLRHQGIVFIICVTLLTSGCTSVESTGEEFVDVSTSSDIEAGGETEPETDAVSEDGAVSVDTNLDVSTPDVVTPDITSPDAQDDDVDVVAVPDSMEDADVPEGCEEGGCFLQECEEPSDCFSGICVPHLGGKVCSETCEAECPSGFLCSLISLGSSDPSYICVSSFPNLCQPCHSTSECASDGASSACLVYGEQGSFCGGSCEEDADCPSGFACEDTLTTSGGSSMQCVSESGECTCSSNAMNLALSTPCSVSNEHGVCEGLRICSASGLSDCDAAVPSEDLCDGVDNDCDGQLDNGQDCDDSNPCLQGECAGAEGCVYSALIDEPCDDGQDSTSNDLCDANGECVGAPYTCPDTTVCITEYLQNGADCLPQFADSGVPCDDGSPSTDNDICDGFGGCLGTPFGCPPASTCTPGYTQQDGECSPNFAEAGTACNDGDATTQQDTCDGAGSCAGEPYECPTTSACVLAYEQDGSGCAPSYAAAGVACDDGIATTQNDVCNGSGACAGVPYECPAPTTCVPSHTPDGSGCLPNFAGAGTPCNDNDPATQSDVCDGSGGCAGTPFGCPQGSICTPSYTQDGGGCTPNHADFGTPCDDGIASTKDDVCSGFGVCAGEGYECPAPSACTPSYSQNGESCVPNHAQAGTPCNDGNNGTQADVCDGAGACSGSPYSCPGTTACIPAYSQDGSGCVPQYANSGTACDDGNNGTQNDVCNGSGACAGSPFNCPPTTTCTPGYSQNGVECVPNYAPSGTGCNDGDNGTSGDVCNGAGGCSGTPYGCPGATTCTPSYLQDGSGCIPQYAGSGTGCDDGNNGTSGDVCNGAGGCSGTPYSCPGGSACTPSYSQDGGGCIPNHAPPGSGCNDGSNATKNDVCDGSGGCGGTPYSCPGGSACTPSYSQDGSGCSPNHAASGTGCNDGSNSTKNDVCDGSGGCAGAPYSCPGGTVCTPNYSQDGSGCSPNHAASGTGCNDGSNSTKNDVCDGSGGCAGAPYSCPGGTTCTPSYSQDGSGCVANHAASGTGCDDSSNTTNKDVCDGSGGCAGVPYSCPGGTSCTPSYSQDGSGCVPSYAPKGTSCDDNDAFTIDDICDGAGGCAGKAPVCGNGIKEAGEQCDGGACCTGSCTYAANGTTCGVLEPWECWQSVCLNGACGGLDDTCDFNEHCCEGGCFPYEMQCP